MGDELRRREEAKQALDRWLKSTSTERVLTASYLWRDWAEKSGDPFELAVWEECQDLAKAEGYEYADGLFRKAGLGLRRRFNAAGWLAKYRQRRGAGDQAVS